VSRDANRWRNRFIARLAWAPDFAKLPLPDHVGSVVVPSLIGLTASLISVWRLSGGNRIGPSGRTHKRLYDGVPGFSRVDVRAILFVLPSAFRNTTCAFLVKGFAHSCRWEKIPPNCFAIGIALHAEQNMVRIPQRQPAAIVWGAQGADVPKSRLDDDRYRLALMLSYVS
jgi:hypothetical protein